MKINYCTLTFIMILFALSSCTKDNRELIVGTWQLDEFVTDIDAEITYANGDVNTGTVKLEACDIVVDWEFDDLYVNEMGNYLSKRVFDDGMTLNESQELELVDVRSLYVIEENKLVLVRGDDETTYVIEQLDEEVLILTLDFVEERENNGTQEKFTVDARYVLSK